MGRFSDIIPDGVPSDGTLTTATVDEIYEELFNRFPDGVILAVRHMFNDEIMENPCRMGGKIDTLFCLNARALHHINEVVTRKEGRREEIEEEDEEEETF